MPIRINLLAEQQEAEEARRKDPVKRAVWIGSALVFLTVIWTLLLHMEVKAKRQELVNIDDRFRKLEEGAKATRARMVEASDIKNRITSLERYSNNRVLWASTFDAFQKVTMEQIRFKGIQFNQRYSANVATNFFVTNLTVGFEGRPPAWKFWAGPPKATPVLSLASNMFRTFTNAAPFSTNKLPYTVKMSVTATNLPKNEVTIKCEFGLPAVSIEDIDMLISAGDYGNPPGAAIDEFVKKLLALPYFAQRLGTSENRFRFADRPPNAEPDPNEPGQPMFQRFAVRLKYEDRVLTNE
jgi:hypothetical protein